MLVIIISVVIIGKCTGNFSPRKSVTLFVPLILHLYIVDNNSSYLTGFWGGLND